MKGVYKINFTEKQVEEIIHKYSTLKINTHKLAEEYKTQDRRITKVLRENGIVVKLQKHTINLSFFDKITPDVMYVLGFIAADGYVNPKLCRLEINQRNPEILYKIQQLMETDYAIKKRDMPYNHKGVEKIYIGYYLTMSGKKLTTRLTSLGLTHGKSKRCVLSKEITDSPYFSHFIRGFFDGDGWVSKNRIGFIGLGTMLTTVKQFLEAQGIVVSRLYPTPTQDLYTISICRKKSRETFKDLIYKDSKDITRLSRKYNKFFLDGNLATYDYFLTGCFGFIATHFLYYILENTTKTIYGVDYLGIGNNYAILQPLIAKYRSRFHFDLFDLADTDALAGYLENKHFTNVVHMAANSHVDRSIASVKPFIQSNVVGTSVLLEYFNTRREKLKQFLYVSTDEVVVQDTYTTPFLETDKLNPRNPYSATKAAGELLCNAFFKTYDFPVKVSRCSNNYGDFQGEEKYLPTVLRKLLKEEKVPIYGTGENEREWIFATDHVLGLLCILEKGTVGETYHIGSDFSLKNIDLYKRICQELGLDPACHFEFVKDRLGHDKKYQLNVDKLKALGYNPVTTFEEGLNRTISYFKDKFKLV